MKGLPDERAATALVHEIIDDGAYMTLATADEDGLPWATPVWYAPESYTRLLWISRPEARHSQNIAVRAQVGIVIFDSHAPIGTGQGVYMDAIAEEEIERAIAAFSARSQLQGGDAFSTADVRAPASHRLYRATASRVFLGARDRRVPVSVD